VRLHEYQFEEGSEKMKMKLRALRVNKGFSAKQVALFIGVKDPRTVLNYENGTHKAPHETVAKLAKLYDWPMDQIEL